MKRFFILHIIALFFIGLTAYTPMPKPHCETIYKQFLADYEQFAQQITSFNSELDLLDTEEVQQSFSALRTSFKTIEPLLAYYLESEYNLYFNGAPLPKLEPNAPEIKVLDPKGMQVIDEIVYADAIDKTALKSQLSKLQKATQLSKKLLLGIHPEDRHIIEATRSQIIRTVSLGLSGFDTPGSGLYISDAIASNQTLVKYLAAYTDIMRNEDKNIINQLKALEGSLVDAKTQENVDFAFLIREYYSPLYGDILDFHLASGIEHAREVSNILSPLNYYAKGLFEEDFLNLSTFNRISPEDYNQEKISLGEKLFYDNIMSQSSDMSCATCHKPELAFTDGKSISSPNSSDQQLHRNTPTLINSIYSKRYFYDMRATKPDLQIDHVIYNPDEFHFNYDSISHRLKADASYNSLFAQNYGSNSINRYSITDAIIQYVSSLSGFSSEFDQYMRKEKDVYSEEALAGFNLFMGKGACASCHFVPLFNGTVPPSYEDSESEILGVLASNDFTQVQLDNDPGRILNGNQAEASEIYHRSFKTPSVRNAALTAPYMHNGVHPNLDDVLTFYNNGGGAGMGQDVPYQTLAPDSLGLSTVEMKQIIVFMETLTDTTGMMPKPLANNF